MNIPHAYKLRLNNANGIPTITIIKLNPHTTVDTFAWDYLASFNLPPRSGGPVKLLEFIQAANPDTHYRVPLQNLPYKVVFSFTHEQNQPPMLTVELEDYFYLQFSGQSLKGLINRIKGYLFLASPLRLATISQSLSGQQGNPAALHKELKLIATFMATYLRSNPVYDADCD